MHPQSHNPDSSEEAGSHRREAGADDAQGMHASRPAPSPPWLQAADLEALAERFAPLAAAEVRQLALDFDQGSTPVEVLLLRLAGAGLTPPAAQQLIVDLRLLREQRSQKTTPSAAEGSELAAALSAAAMSYLLHPGDDEQAARAIATQAGWSPVRARWFLALNQEQVRQTADRLASERPPDT